MPASPTFEELLAASRNAAPPFKDVPVLFDTGLSDEIDRLKAEYALLRQSKDRRLGEASPAAAVKAQLEELQAQLGAQVVTFRLTRLPGDAWANITAPLMPREGVPIDMRYGYDLAAATKIALPLMGRRLDGDELVAVEEADWETICEFPEFDDFQDAVLFLQTWAPQLRLDAAKEQLEAAKKASREGSPRTPASPATSASPSNASTDGSPATPSPSATTSAAASPKR